MCYTCEYNTSFLVLAKAPYTVDGGISGLTVPSMTCCVIGLMFPSDPSDHTDQKGMTHMMSDDSQLPSIYISLGILIVHASHLQKGRTWNSQWSTICKGSSTLLHKACQQSPNSNKTLGRIWGSIKALDSRSKVIHTQTIKMLSPWPTTRITVCVFSF